MSGCWLFKGETPTSGRGCPPLLEWWSGFSNQLFSLCGGGVVCILFNVIFSLRYPRVEGMYWWSVGVGGYFRSLKGFSGIRAFKVFRFISSDFAISSVMIEINLLWNQLLLLLNLKTNPYLSLPFWCKWLESLCYATKEAFCLSH